VHLGAGAFINPNAIATGQRPVQEVIGPGFSSGDLHGADALEKIDSRHPAGRIGIGGARNASQQPHQRNHQPDKSLGERDCEVVMRHDNSPWPSAKARFRLPGSVDGASKTALWSIPGNIFRGVRGLSGC